MPSAIKAKVKNSLRWAFTGARWASNVVNRSNPEHSYKVWLKRIPSGGDFWDGWLAGKGLQWPEDYKRKTDPNSEIQPEAARFIRSKDDKIIDVGAGPLTALGKIWNGHRLNITAVDPLGDVYERMLAKHNVVPPVKTQTVAAEELTTFFPENTFDLAYASNCIDHSYSPLRSVEQMIAITKPGGYVVLHHESDEGSNELYRGLHQWNFRQEDGDFVVASPGRPKINISKTLAHKAKFTCEQDGPWLTVIAEKH